MLFEPLLFVSCPPSIVDAIRARMRSLARGCSTSQESATPQVIVTCDLAGAAFEPVPAIENDASSVVIGLAARRVMQVHAGRDRVCIDCLQHWLRTALGDRYGRVPPTDAEAITDDVFTLASRLAGHWLSADMTSASGDDALPAAVAEGRGRDDDADATALIEIDAFTGARTTHAIVRRRDCGRCRDWHTAASAHADLRAHYSASTGIVTKIELFTARVPGIVAAGAIAVSPLDSGHEHQPVARTTSFGTFGYGATLRDAENGCIGEALERYCATFRAIDSMRRATIDELRATGEAIDPRDILLFSDTQYRERARRNPRLPPRHRIPEPFDPHRAIDWLPARDLISGRCVWVPAACCLLDYPFAPAASAGAGDVRFATADLCGCAAGRTDTDAILHGLLECVERDAHAIWWYNQLARPAVTVDDACSHLIQMRERLAALGHRLTLIDVTTDIEIPSIIAIITTHDGRQPVLGSAAHPDWRVAAQKAGGEAVLNWYCARGGQLPSDIAHWFATASIEASPFLRAASGESIRSRRSERSRDIAPIAQSQESPESQLRDCVDRLQRVGLGPLAIDLTRPDVVAPVWRVIVPGLRHVLDRRAPGRLYDVPVRAGWLRTPRKESELNPLPCTF